MRCNFINDRLSAVFATLIILVSSALSKAQTQTPIAEVPFEFVHNQVVLQVKIGGAGPFNMLLDTDTDPSAIDLATARHLGLKLSGKGRQGTGGGTDLNLAYETRLPLVEVGAVTARDVYAAAINLEKIGDRMGRPVHGVLGHSFLQGRIFQIDYPKRKVRFAKLIHVPFKFEFAGTQIIFFDPEEDYSAEERWQARRATRAFIVPITAVHLLGIDVRL
jgi:hypothetical protein